MNLPDIELPSNRKFGLFFSGVFLVCTLFFLATKNPAPAAAFVVCTVAFFLVALLKSDVLLPLNKAWMRIGLLLGLIVSPIVLSIIFFGLFTPLGVAMRLFGRDELRLHQKTRLDSYWKTRDSKNTPPNSFRNQF